MIDLYFYANDNTNKNPNATGSAIMRSIQICKNIQQRFKFINAHLTTKYENIKNSNFLFVKDNFQLNVDILKHIKSNKNIIIFDILDYYDSTTNQIPDLHKNHFIDYIDILIVNNTFMRKKYYKLNMPIYIVPHHYDIRLTQQPIPPKNNQLTFIYNGELGTTNQNCLYINELKKEYNLVHSTTFNEFINKYNKRNYCFISIRKEDSYEFNYRPLMKLAHAAATDSNIIITKDKSVIDFIDPNYPYLLNDSSYETVTKMINHVKNTYNKEVWKTGLKMMEQLKIRLNINHILSYDYMKIFKYLEKPINPKTNYKICFVTSYFGSLDYFELSNNFPKNENMDYYCFTNLSKRDLGKMNWEIIEINPTTFYPSISKNQNKNKNILLNRYFKFMTWKFLDEKMNKKYDFIFYCDHYLNPNADIPWMKICDQLKNSELGFIQYEHKRYYEGILKDLEMIVKNNTEDQINIDKAKNYLKSLKPQISLRTPQYFENTVFGMNCTLKKARKFTNLFWQHYSNDYPSYRDQPLWNYLYLFRDIYPYTDNELRYYFNGFKKIWRTKENY